ncbi:hypothetical protein ACT17_18445 [Mycolicibacterium conceptionense]|jgi:hypothetical protein|uniref:DUF4190 domain-containing protein n=2 Tax=Mycolicibacterium TaxID=1866885 RepID=A0ABR5G288_9MYCO|nr:MULTISPECIES: DUF4190 domain-containing protein [Mycolicibacterium]KLI04596.1 hypothetical protein AA982_29075 [Mycolicibacterium senegalense]KLO54286.1 hypothetical protein ABW05_25325 [Mycolicibacterium senegalense]KMV16863.1 hypothetical protein ACT17_18445 [Mycolicibacterium conceptionense]OBK00881.1 hypothetical protein A5639_26515 [Mycolicibacterium conceptionense]OMB73934.1 hypothetical protein A5741_04850 [Mycolicibacterium conceptionense]
MTNPDGNAGETPPSDPGPQPSEPLSGGYEAPSIEHSQDLPQNAGAQPSYEFGPQGYEVTAPYPPAIDYPADIPPDYPQSYPPPYPPPPYPPPYPPPVPGYPPTPGYGPPGYPAYPAGYGMPPATTSNVAIGSLAASLISLFMFGMCGLGLLAAIVGIGLGITALKQIDRSGQSGRGLAIAGIILGAIGALIGLGWVLYFVAVMLAV